jgi:hypothetical protein
VASIQLIVGDAALTTTGDVVLHDLLVGLGFSVTYVSDETAENTTGFAGVVIANSVVSATIGTKYNTCTLPVVTHESGNVNDLRLCDVDAFGSDNNLTLVVDAPSHPIMNGPYGTFTSTVAFMSSSTGLVLNIDTSSATLGAGVTAVAEHPTAAALKVILAADSGATLSGGGAAPNKRAFIFPHDTEATTMAGNGIAILKNAYTWAFAAAAAQTLLPDADLATAGWTTAPLFSKVNDSSDATIITATAS